MNTNLSKITLTALMLLSFTSLADFQTGVYKCEYSYSGGEIYDKMRLIIKNQADKIEFCHLSYGRPIFYYSPKEQGSSGLNDYPISFARTHQITRFTLNSSFSFTTFNQKRDEGYYNEEGLNVNLNPNDESKLTINGHSYSEINGRSRLGRSPLSGNCRKLSDQELSESVFLKDITSQEAVDDILKACEVLAHRNL